MEKEIYGFRICLELLFKSIFQFKFLHKSTISFLLKLYYLCKLKNQNVQILNKCRLKLVCMLHNYLNTLANWCMFL